LFLDTLPYNAHTTASDALWAGLPVLTLMGQSFAARVAASLLQALDLPELITDTPQAYEEMALKLAQQPEWMAQIRVKLARQRLSSTLFDGALFTRHLEKAYKAVHERHQRGLPPAHITVPA
jgi:protein O-GlcNAc transferase